MLGKVFFGAAVVFVAAVHFRWLKIPHSFDWDASMVYILVLPFCCVVGLALLRDPS